MDYLPESVLYETAEMRGVSRNTFRLETISAETAGPNRIVSFNLPENSIIDMKSICYHADVACASPNPAGIAIPTDQVFAKIPQHGLASMIERIEIYANGIALTNGSSSYNVIAQMLRLGQSNIDKENSIDRALNNSHIDATDTNDNKSLILDQFDNFLNRLSTRYVNTSALGNLMVRISYASNACLVPKSATQTIGTNLNPTAQTNAQAMSYSISNQFFTIDTIALDPFYEDMIRQRLVARGLEINFKDYYSWVLDGISSSASQSRFQISAKSIDKLYGCLRDSNANSVGIRGHAYPDASGVGAFTSNQLRLRNYNNNDQLTGSYRTNWSVNNVRFPQFQMDAKTCLQKVPYCQDKVDPDNSGCLITSFASYNDGKFINPLLLCLPTGRGVAVTSGYDSRSVNTSLVWDNQGLTIPPASATTQETGIVQTLVVAECTSTLRIQVGKDLAVSA